MTIEKLIQAELLQIISDTYEQNIDSKLIQLQKTKKEFEGDLTLVVFPLLRISKKSPEETAQQLGALLVAQLDELSDFNVVKGFLNLSVKQTYWLSELQRVSKLSCYGYTDPSEDSQTIMVEYSSPNTNKPLHLGHIRNNLLGYSLSRIFKANGHQVIKTNIVNDRGIHICKSMYAWQQWGQGETPESTGKKGDKLVGDYYVKFDQEYKKELALLTEKGMSLEEAEQASEIMQAVREMLRKWEAKDPEVYALWTKMNEWVYAGFDVTYKRLGVDFDKIYYESDTYLKGKDMVLEGLDKKIFYQREDSSVWVDLRPDGLDEKILLRSDGTSVYMTQDIGTAKMRFDDFSIDQMVYVVGNEQNYHFKVLSILLDKLGFKWGKDLQHFSYGMVELPEGKMKSREGTVVDADDLMDSMVASAKESALESKKMQDFSPEEAAKVHEMIALGALKYFILKVDPKKNMTFNPSESIDMQGNTGPFIQYTYARTQSIKRKAEAEEINLTNIDALSVSAKELDLIKTILDFKLAVVSAGTESSPALIANYAYGLAKEYNQFYHEFPILKEENQEVQNFRLKLSEEVGKTLKNAMYLLAIEVPAKM